MIKRCYLLALLLGLLFVSGADAQYPIADLIADKVIQKYQQASCEQLWERGPSEFREGTGRRLIVGGTTTPMARHLIFGTHNKWRSAGVS